MGQLCLTHVWVLSSDVHLSSVYLEQCHHVKWHGRDLLL